MGSKVVTGILLLLDAVIVTMAPYMALYLRFEGHSEACDIAIISDYALENLAVKLFVFYLFGLYHRLWRYASINELLAVVGAVTAS